MLDRLGWISLLILVYGAAFACIFRILLTYRTAQGALAWIIALLSVPYVAVPLFVVFGRNRFSGYVRARRSGDRALQSLLDRILRQSATSLTSAPAESPELKVLSDLIRMPFFRHNRCQLLKDGEETFATLFAALEAATDYILLEFYIVRSDRIGQQIKAALKRKLAEGLRVYFIYDEIGSAGLSQLYLDDLIASGARVKSFGTGNSRRRRFQINFRNHRKLLICDGRIGFVGGINLGDEYLEDTAALGKWRDTHCQIEGPAVQALQLAFVEDWNWVDNRVPPLHWANWEAQAADQPVLILPTGPADEFESCTLFFLHLINSARQRLWITSPYFVPDLQILNALQLATLRGVDVRVMIPENPDHKLIRMVSYSYLMQADAAGVGIYQYQGGFMHQKVALVDDRYAAVGTANLDNRSMRLNFEITALIACPQFVAETHAMLCEDLRHCRKLRAGDYQHQALWFRLASRALRLGAPML